MKRYRLKRALPAGAAPPCDDRHARIIASMHRQERMMDALRTTLQTSCKRAKIKIRKREVQRLYERLDDFCWDQDAVRDNAANYVLACIEWWVYRRGAIEAYNVFQDFADQIALSCIREEKVVNK
jgi:hypothetical protein